MTELVTLILCATFQITRQAKNMILSVLFPMELWDFSRMIRKDQIDSWLSGRCKGSAWLLKYYFPLPKLIVGEEIRRECSI